MMEGIGSFKGTISKETLDIPCGALSAANQSPGETSE